MGDDLDDVTQTVSDHVVADAVTVRTRPSRASALDPDVPEGHCTNCQTGLKGQVCHVCGQVDDRYHRPVYSLFMEALDGLFSFDGRAWKTIPPLVFFPGRVTRQYLSGSRARFIPPFRIYIIASLVFFLLFGFLTNDLEFSDIDPNVELNNPVDVLEDQLESGEITQEDYDEIMEGVRLLEESFPGLALESDPDAENSDSQQSGSETSADEASLSGLVSGVDETEPDASQDASGTANDDILDEWTSDGGFLSAVLANIVNDPQAWGQASLAWLPRIMFVMVPLYAGLLALTYLWRRGYFFYDHLVVSIHFHAALFFLMSIVILISPLIGIGWSILSFLIYSNIYLFQLHRRVYSRSIFTSALRVIVLDVAYLVILMFGLLAVVFLGALSLQ